MRRIPAKSARWLLLVAAGVATGCAAPSPAPTQIGGVKNVTQAGNVYIAGAPTEEGLREMKARGVTTVIDLRQEQEGTAQEKKSAQALGLNYIHIPMKSDELTPEQAGAIIGGMEAHKGEKILLHCAGGNRAGAAYGVYLGAGGRCSAEEALKQAEQAGLRNEALKKATRQRIEEAQKK